MDTNTLKKFAQEARIDLQNKINFKIDYVLNEQSPARRENPRAVQELERKINSSNKNKVIEEVAYTWFNRFTALQYMDLNGFNTVRVIAPSDGMTRPEILSDANSGVYDTNIISENTQNIVSALLDGRSASNDPDNEAYQHLIVAACNHWHTAMPFLFEKIADYTELLLPDDLLSSSSILAKLREAMIVDNCQDVEVIGWLYQFYISEKKDEVFAGLKKNQKITPENIPAATQLFTPHWIVKYLVENSLGRLWMLNRPNSTLANQMEYYIKPEEPEAEFLKITSPEEIKVCDPACGSGHMLTYSFDILYQIYKDEGYEESSIPSLILQNNLYGIELDKRAGDLAAFALTMKARSKQRSFLRNPIQPSICVLENVSFDTDELNEYMNAVGRDLFSAPLRTTLTQFEEADNFGSLIQPALEDVESVLQVLQTKDFAGNLFLKSTHDRVLKVLHQAECLRQKYHVVVANPPFMGSKGMNIKIKDYLAKNYKDFKSDLFSAFIIRIKLISLKKGQLGFVTPFVWMYISSYENLRKKIFSEDTLESLVKPSITAFFQSAIVSICAFTIKNNVCNDDYLGNYIDLGYLGNADEQSERFLSGLNGKIPYSPKRNKVSDFKKIPGNPVAYTVSSRVLDIFGKSSIADIANVRLGMATADNDKFLRLWFEVSVNKSCFKCNSREVALETKARWFSYQKGGKFRKWFGNFEYLVNWEQDGYMIKNFKDVKTGKIRSHNYNLDYIFKTGVTWNALTSGKTSARKSESSLFDNAGSSLFPIVGSDLEIILSFINSKIMDVIFPIISSTLNYQPGDISKLPVNFSLNMKEKIKPTFNKLISISTFDWNSYETSWDFASLPFLSIDYRSGKLESSYNSIRSHWQEMTDEMLKLEEENNSIFIDAYGIQDELTPDVPIHEITLTCNPAYRYGQKVSSEDQETRLRADTMKEFISYSVGCMFGRYALEESGLILANAGDTIETYMDKVPNPSFPADDDNVIPILNAEWFEDDIVGRFRKFLRLTFGDENFEENLNFIETAIGRSIRDYFTKDFYKDHVQTYKKRPIYWQFSSPKGSFNVLIYMHRYNKDTVSTILNSYLRDYQSKLIAEKTAQERIEVSATSNAVEKTKALKDIQSITLTLNELEEWERDVIFPLASQRIEIDLDDGVKINYPRFGSALTKVVGLS